MRNRPSIPKVTSTSRPNRTPRRSSSATAAQLHREHARNLAWFNI